MEPNEETYLSYAIDLGTEVNPVPHPEDGRLTRVKVVKGILQTTTSSVKPRLTRSRTETRTTAAWWSSTPTAPTSG